MKTKLLLATALAACAALFAAGAASGAFVAIYRNAMETTAQRAEIRRVAGKSCTRGGGRTTLKITVGKRTEECAYRTPVIGTDLEIAVTGRVLGETPRRVARKAFLGLQLRVGGGGKLELRVFPAQRKVQLVKITPEDGIRYLAIEKKVKAVQGTTRANVLRLRVVSAARQEAGTCKIAGYLGHERVVEAVEEKCGEVHGEFTAISAGAPNNGSGVIAGFGPIVVRVPVRF